MKPWQVNPWNGFWTRFAHSVEAGVYGGVILYLSPPLPGVINAVLFCFTAAMLVVVRVQLGELITQLTTPPKDGEP